MSFASSFNMLSQFSSNKKANTHTQNAHESCEFQKGKKRTHFYRWRGPQSFQQRKCSQSDSISKQQSLVKTALLLAVTIASFDIDRDALMKDATLKCVSRVPYSALK
ncbi:putative adipocyte plasma membrane-associated protein [Trichinella spiralis]|uniref:putative adipocyte plasma membrane-associated protein n=1 Tax=Trichinella spiralis TaxID=6334 RepID=UPI0001EFC38E|nr:putative adipocyte plasma membrane-associated protein [Trichinella spiralis]